MENSETNLGPNRIRGSPFVRAMKMSVTDECNDIYLAHAYPFLYARKLRYAFVNHFWERFLVSYGMWGLQLVVLIIIAITIVGGYCTAAQHLTQSLSLTLSLSFPNLSHSVSE